MPVLEIQNRVSNGLGFQTRIGVLNLELSLKCSFFVCLFFFFKH